jgi:hypothetical protein
MFEMSQILNCGLDQKTLSILVSLIENGVNPEALAAVVKELKRETEALKVCKGKDPKVCFVGCKWYVSEIVII